MIQERAKRLGFNDEEVAQIIETQQAAEAHPDHQETLQDLRHAIKMQNTQAVALLLDSGSKIHGSCYPLTMIVQSLQQIDDLYEHCDISPSVRDATLSDIHRWSTEHRRRNNGVFGLSQVFWIARHLTAKIVQLGSLQFEPKVFGYPYRIYRDDAHALLLVAQSEVTCDAGGYITEANNFSFTTQLIDDGHTLLAHPVNPNSGAIEPDPSHFSLSALTLIADNEQELINIHIPSEADLSPAAVDDALSQAIHFFASHPLFVCVSWLIDPALEIVAKPESNIVSFMQRFTKFSVPHQLPQLYERVFGQGYDRSAVLAHHSTTSLQKAVQRELQQGMIFRTMGGLLPTIDTSVL
ncbi:MAG: acyltransferase domain-containing protein [Sphaerochaeta sp.]|jgi:hypothetical protein|nr:DUF5596 domain-containing protein [Spirochaetales bacterium]